MALDVSEGLEKELQEKIPSLKTNFITSMKKRFDVCNQFLLNSEKKIIF